MMRDLLAGCAQRPSHYLTRLALGLLGALVLVSCGEKDSPSSALEVTRATVLPAPDVARELWSLDEEFAYINRRVPGFAGYTYNGKGEAEVALVDTNSLPAATTAIEASVSNSAFVMGNGVRARKVRFDFLDLAVFKEQVVTMLDLDVVSSIDIDEMRNKVVVGLVDAAAVKEAVAIQDNGGLEGVPRDAVVFEERERFVPDVAAAASSELSPLQGLGNVLKEVKPRVGGVSLSVPAGGCTLGFNGHLMINGVNTRGFVTNSHCTDNYLAPDWYNKPFKQPYTNGVTIGREKFDPYSERHSDCIVRIPEAGYECRRSDAAFIKYEGNITSDRKIAIADINRNITKIAPVKLVIRGKVGIMAWRSGASSGLSKGSVVETCVDVPAAQTKTYFICQDIASYSSKGGDSGSPVFNGSPQSLMGIHWGRRAPEGIYRVYSPFSGIARDLGVSLAVLD